MSLAKNPVSKPAAPVQQRSAGGGEIVIPLTIKVGKSFQAKLPLLIGLLLFFSFSMVLFDKSNLKTTDLTDLPRVQFNVPKLYSISFVLFLVLFSIALALGIYYSIGLGWAASTLVLPVAFVPALLLGLVFYPWLLTTFLSLAFIVSFCSFLASFWKSLSLSNAWAALSAGMLLFALLAFIVVFYKVAENKDAHVNLLLDSLVAQAGTGVNIPVTGQMVSSAISKDDFGAFVAQGAVRDLLASSYPGFSSLSNDQKDSVVQTFRSKLLDVGYSSFQQNSGAIAQSVAQNLAQLLSGGPQALKQQIYSLPQFKTVYDHFAFLSASLAALIAAFAGFIIQIIAIGLLFALKTLLPLPE